MGKTKEIHKVCLSGNLERFNEIMRLNKFSVNTRDNLNFTPLMCASFSGNKEIVKKLLKLDKIQINARSRNKKTALILAATRGHFDIVKLLVKHGANTDLRQFQNSKKACRPKTALDMSLLCNHKNITRFLKKKKTKKAGKYIYWNP